MLANQILKQIVELGQGKPSYNIAGQMERNLIDNPYWPPELAAQAGKLPHERYVVFLPLALSKTQDDKDACGGLFSGAANRDRNGPSGKAFICRRRRKSNHRKLSLSCSDYFRRYIMRTVGISPI